LKIHTIDPCYVKFIPDKLEEGLLYISEEFHTAIHLCACGCKEKTVTPLNGTMWTLKIIQGKPTLYPSIGNFHIPCKSHYFITHGKVIVS